ncbi:MAG: 7-cyano-7-deazaguanine synthase QueC [Planctomycetota bacterium]|nr:7-cyano-7-deazaguanine synthase QueC [Planctomycetota bacterium]
MTPSRKAVLLLSGGLDSCTTLAIAQQQGFDVHAISFRYGQRHSHELSAASEIARSMQVAAHVTLDINLGDLVASALTTDIPVPKHSSTDEIESSIPVTYVPARNTVFLSFALGWAEELGAADIFLGVNALDYSGYPDCRPEYLAAFETLANLATKSATQDGQRTRIHAPLIDMTKAQIIETGLQLGVDYSLTTSCYDPAPEGTACGECDACLLRLKGFAENGIDDPISYQAR